MLVLTRKIGERIMIEPGIEISIVEVRGGKVRIGVKAPRDIRVDRAEVAERNSSFRATVADPAVN
jgi:carbon storage regulator